MNFRIPVPVNIAVLVLATTALYTHIGQLVPQTKIMPPEEVVIRDDMTTEELVQVGLEIMKGKGLCFTCHTVGKTGVLRFPDLDDIGARAEKRVEGKRGIQYLAESIYDPDLFVVEGFLKGMPRVDRPPIGLTEREILAVLASMQGMGGTPDITLETTRADLGLE